MTETDIQNYLHRCFAGRNYEIPNVYLYDWESDFISVTRAGYIHEYEIKISKSDFKNDVKSKSGKHEVVQCGCRSPKEYEQMYIKDYEKIGLSEVPPWIAKKLTTDNKIIGNRPNYFWYVCPENLITEVPEYAGLIYCKPYLQIVKPAPRLHKGKISSVMEKKILSSFCYRYWKIRMTEAKHDP